MQESSKSFLIKDLLRDLVHNTDSLTPGTKYKNIFEITATDLLD